MSDYDKRKALRQEADEVVEYLRSTFTRMPRDDFFRIAVLRALALIVKMLLYRLDKD